jgi:hypothetical protein
MENKTVVTCFGCGSEVFEEDAYAIQHQGGGHVCEVCYIEKYLMVDNVLCFKQLIFESLDNAVKENGYVNLLTDRPEDVADNMVDLVSDLEQFGADNSGLLVPYIMQWQFEQRIKKGN